MLLNMLLNRQKAYCRQSFFICLTRIISCSLQSSFGFVDYYDRSVVPKDLVFPVLLPQVDAEQVVVRPSPLPAASL